LRRVRILRVITRLNIGGPSIQAITLSHRLANRGYETLLVHGRLGSAEGDMSYLLPPGVRTRPLTALRREIAPLSDARAVAALVRIMREWQPDVVHTHMAKAGSAGRVAAAIASALGGRKPAARVVHTYHGHVLEGYFGPAKTRAFIAVERGLSHVTDRIIAISPHIARELLEAYHIGRADQYRVVPLGFDLDPLARIDDRSRRAARAARGIAPDAQVVATVGRLTAIKQHSLFLDVARLVAAADPSALFLIAGDGELRDALEQRARAGGLAERVRFLGWRRDLDVVYGATDVFLLTSANEGTPVALIESLAAGVAGVSTDVGGVRDVIATEEIGRLAPRGDARALANHVSALLADADLRRRIGEAGRRSVLARYGIDRLVEDVDRVYRELVNSLGSAGL
jgi:glycosyltransferase involved in cell wall biosynthesis